MHRFRMSQYYSRPELEALGFASLGRDVEIHRSSNIVFPERISIGSHVRIDGFVTIIASGPVSIGNRIHISPYVHIAARGGFTMMNYSGLSSGVRCYTSSDDYSGEYMTNPTVPLSYTNVKVAPIELGEHVIVGSNTVILPGVTIGQGSSVGALSLIAKSLDPWGVYAGAPVRRIRDRSRRLLCLAKELESAEL